MNKAIPLFALIEWLERQDQCRAISNGFGFPHNGMGRPQDLHFEPSQSTYIRVMLHYAKFSLGEYFTSSDGEKKLMSKYTKVFVGDWQHTSEPITAKTLKEWSDQDV